MRLAAQGAATRDGAVRASAVAVQATASVEHPQQAKALAVGLGGFAADSGNEVPPQDAGSSARIADGALAVGVEAGQGLKVSASGAVQSVEPMESIDAPQLAERLADTVQRAVRVGQREFRMELHPPELGRLEVRVVETADGVRVTVRASSREASELIQQHLPLLRSALESRDLRVDRVEVFQADHPDAGEAGAERRSRSDPDGDEHPLWSPLAAMEQETASEASQPPLRLAPGSVDLMA